MKKFYQVGGLVVIIGIVLLFVGKMNNGNRSLQSVHSGISQIGKSNHHRKGSNKARQGRESKTFNVAKFTKIKLDANRPDIRISQGKKFQITISGSDGADITKIKTTVKHNELRIFDKPEKHYTDGFYYVNVTVPNVNSLKEITGSSSIGNFHLINLTIPTIKLNKLDGTVTLDKVNINKAYIYLTGDGMFKIADSTLADSTLWLSGDGAFKITGSTLTDSSVKLNDGEISIKNSQFKMVTSLREAEVKIKNSKLLGNSSFKTNTGDFKMNDAPKITYNLSTDPNSSIKFRGQHKLSHFTSTVNKTPTLKVISKYGDITIE